MPQLKLSRSAPTPSSGSRAELPLPLQRVFSAQHLDDASEYHSGDHKSKGQDEDSQTEDSDDLEQVRNNDHEEEPREGKEEAPGLRIGVVDRQDLEANLEKTRSTRSVKDPNLVRAVDCNLCKMTPLLIGFLGIVGQPRRPRESQELDVQTEMGCHHRCILLHSHLACLVIDGGACSHINI